MGWTMGNPSNWTNQFKLIAVVHPSSSTSTSTSKRSPVSSTHEAVDHAWQQLIRHGKKHLKIETSLLFQSDIIQMITAYDIGDNRNFKIHPKPHACNSMCACIKTQGVLNACATDTLQTNTLLHFKHLSSIWALWDRFRHFHLNVIQPESTWCGQTGLLIFQTMNRWQVYSEYDLVHSLAGSLISHWKQHWDHI